MREICIECHHVIKNASPTTELHDECSRLRDNRANCARNKSTTTGRNGDRPSEFAAKGGTAPRPARKTSLNFSDIMHAPPGQAIKYLDRILAGESVLTG